MVDRSREQRLPISPNEIAALVHDDSLHVDWEIGRNLDPETIQRVLSDFAADEIDEAVRQSAGEVVDSILQASKYDKCLDIEMIIQEGKLFLRTISGGHYLSATQDVRRDFRHFWEAHKNYFTPSGKGHLRSSFLNAMYARLMEHLHQLNDPSNFRNLQILLEEVEEQLDGKDAEEIIAFLYDNALTVEWTIKPYQNYNGAYVIGRLNKKILESFGEGVPEKLAEEAGRESIHPLLQGTVDWHLYQTMIYKFVVRGGKLFFERECLWPKESPENKRAVVYRFVDFIGHTFDDFSWHWPAYKKHFFGPILDHLRRMPRSMPGRILIESIEEVAMRKLGHGIGS